MKVSAECYIHCNQDMTYPVENTSLKKLPLRCMQRRKQRCKMHFNLLRELHLRMMCGLPGPQSPLWQSLLILSTSGNCSPTFSRLGWCTCLTPVLTWQKSYGRLRWSGSLLGNQQRNLASQHALKVTAVAWLIARVRRISTFFHRSTAAADALKRNQRMLGLPHHKLITDVAVWWNSAYEMLPGFWSSSLRSVLPSSLLR